MLLRKRQAPLAAVSKEIMLAEDVLFLRLEAEARDRPFLLDCSVQQVGDDDFVVVVSDHESGDAAGAWSGPADGVVVEFAGWLDRRFPRVGSFETGVVIR